MRILDRLKNAWNVLTRPAVYMDDDELKEWLGITGTNPDVEKEVTYYTCLKMLSETMGKVPLKYYRETPKRPNQSRADQDNQTFVCAAKYNNDTDNSVDHYRDELSALWKWLYLDAWYL
ncbi:MAG: hypothetical protein ACLS61_03455 [Ruminococcus sp.]